MDIIALKVERPSDTVMMIIMKNKMDGTYSYVNITKGHICPCKFLTIQDAINDLEEYKDKGKVLRYNKVELKIEVEEIKEGLK